MLGTLAPGLDSALSPRAAAAPTPPLPPSTDARCFRLYFRSLYRKLSPALLNFVFTKRLQEKKNKAVRLCFARCPSALFWRF